MGQEKGLKLCLGKGKEGLRGGLGCLFNPVRKFKWKKGGKRKKRNLRFIVFSNFAPLVLEELIPLSTPKWKR